MTNAELYISDENMIDNFIDDFNGFVIEHSKEVTPLRELMVKFFQSEAKIEKEEIDPSTFTDKKYDFDGVVEQ